MWSMDLSFGEMLKRSRPGDTPSGSNSADDSTARRVRVRRSTPCMWRGPHRSEGRVIGGGVAGMTTAYRLMQQGHEVALFEASPTSAVLCAPSRSAALGSRPTITTSSRTDTTIIKLIDELGLGDRMQWIDSKVGWFDNGKIYRSSRRSISLRFAPLPLIDRVQARPHGG